MAIYKRPDLKDRGFTDEQIDYLMTESGRSLAANYVLKSDVQDMINEALKKATPENIDIKTSQEYVELARERDMLRAISGDEFSSVKPKFRENVYSMLQFGDDAKPVADQLAGIKEKFDEYFISEEKPTGKPNFGSPDKGGMPTGEEGAVNAFRKAWGYSK